MREHPKTGPYVEGLSSLLVDSHRAIGSLMEEGDITLAVETKYMYNAPERGSKFDFRASLQQQICFLHTAQYKMLCWTLHFQNIYLSNHRGTLLYLLSLNKSCLFTPKSIFTLPDCLVVRCSAAGGIMYQGFWQTKPPLRHCKSSVMLDPTAGTYSAGTYPGYGSNLSGLHIK